MKATSSILFTIVLLAGNLFFCSQAEYDENADKEAIQEMVNTSYRALLDKDWESYRSTWAHKKTAARVSISQNGTREILGWENLEQYYKNLIENWEDQTGVEFEYRNFTINIEDELAWASFDKYMKRDDQFVKESRELRVLIKEDGKWKNLSLLFVW